MSDLFEPNLLERLPNDWAELFRPLENNSDWEKLVGSINQKEKIAREQLRENIVPSYDKVFRALFLTPVKNTKVVICNINCSN